jgi:hypothetical protein
MSVKALEQKVYFVLVPLLLAAGTGIAVWLALFNEPEGIEELVTLPFFSYQVPEKTAIHSPTDMQHIPGTPVREIFSITAAPGKNEQLLSTHEVGLGIVVVMGDKRFCLTNGVIYKEGEGNSDFTVHTIEANGVRYQIGDKTVFLQAGERLTVDGAGNIRK